MRVESKPVMAHSNGKSLDHQSRAVDSEEQQQFARRGMSLGAAESPSAMGPPGKQNRHDGSDDLCCDNAVAVPNHLGICRQRPQAQQVEDTQIHDDASDSDRAKTQQLTEPRAHLGHHCHETRA